MNIYKFELKSHLKSFIIWNISIITTLVVFMGFIYPVFEESKETVVKILDNFPKEFALAFGLNINSFFSYEGFYGFSYLYLSIIGAIMAVIFSLSIFGREKRSKCIDFILTKPRSRSKIFIEKFAAAMTLLLLSNLIYVMVAMIIYPGNNDKYFLAVLSLLFTEIVFLIIGIVVATLSKKIRSISGLANAIGFGAFTVSSLANIIDDKKLNYLAPLKYFDPNEVLVNGSYDSKLVIFSIVLMIIGLLFSYYVYCKTDAHAV